MRIKGFSKAQITLNNLATEKFAASGYTKDANVNKVVVLVEPPNFVE